MLKSLLLAAGVLAALTTQAQQAPVTVPVQASTNAVYTQADTVQAIHSMYRRHRTGGRIWSGIGAFFTARILTAAVTSGESGGVVPGIILFGGVPGGIGVGKLARFGVAREAEVISAYEQGKALPQPVQRRLKKKKYFAR